MGAYHIWGIMLETLFGSSLCSPEKGAHPVQIDSLCIHRATVMLQKSVHPSLQLRLLGPPQVKLAGQPLAISRRKVQALLYYLALQRDIQPRATLATLLWPESDQQYASGSLRRHLSELNRLLGRGWLEIKQDGVRLARRGELWVDVAEFQRLIATCQEHDHPITAVCARCIEPLTAAADLYRDDFLIGFTLSDAPDFDDWQLFQREELRFALANVLDRLVEAHQEQENVGEAIPLARRRLSLDPLHEPAHRQLMHLYAVSGQQRAALRQYERCVQLLQSELEAPPAPETITLYDRIRRDRMVTTEASTTHANQAPQATRHNLVMPTTPLIGRTTEIAELVKLVADPNQRLITVLGPGGIGKTRLALAVAHQVVGELSRNSFIVYLAQLSDPTTIIPTIADALNFQFQTDGRSNKTQLFAYLAQKELLLILDNLEHLLDGVNFIQELLEQCPQVCLLITSRERLKLTGETIYTLQSLEFPTWETPEELQHYAAVQLFFETARRVRPNIVFQADELQYIARICRMVGGMPLGIILAATWVEHLAPATIAAELTRGFDLLAAELRDLPERQRSMRTILDYSWQRLTPGEQTVFMRLSIFPGGFNRITAQAVVDASLPGLVRLVDKSLVQSVAGERYEVHELLRQYAEQRLIETGAYAALESAHGTYFLMLLHDAEARLAGAEQLAAIAQIEAEWANIRAAWLWAVTANRDDLIDNALDGLFRWFWLRRSRQQEGLALIRVAAQCWAPVSRETVKPLWGRLVARQIEQQGPWLVEPAVVRERAERALALAEQENNNSEIALCHWVIGLTIVSENRTLERASMEPAIPYYESAIRFYRARGNHFWLAQSLEFLGHNYRQLEKFELAMKTLNESLMLRRQLGDRLGMARSYREIAWVRFFQGLGHETIKAAEIALAIQKEFGDRQGIIDGTFFLALSFLCYGDWQRVKRLIRPVQEFALEVSNELYQKWSADVLTIASAMETHMAQHKLDACGFPNRFTPFTPRLVATIFSLHEFHVSTSLIAFRRNVGKLIQAASTEEELTICLPFAGIFARELEHPHQAIQLLALAHKHPIFAATWVSHLPEIKGLQSTLRTQLPPAEFAQAWAQGEALALQEAITAVYNELFDS